MDNDEPTLSTIVENTLERLEYITVKLVRVLRATVIELNLLIHLLRKARQHRIALS